MYAMPSALLGFDLTVVYVASHEPIVSKVGLVRPFGRRDVVDEKISSG